eukprot:5452528-Amphidinium_carterae.1
MDSKFRPPGPQAPADLTDSTHWLKRRDEGLTSKSQSAIPLNEQCHVVGHFQTLHMDHSFYEVQKVVSPFAARRGLSSRAGASA